MPLDANIILQGQTQAPQAQDPLSSLAKIMTIKNLGAESQMNSLKLQQAQREMGDDQSVRDAYKNNMQTNPDGSSSLNRQGVLSDLNKQNPILAMKANAQFQQSDVDSMHKKMELLRDVTWSMTPENYQDKLKQLTQIEPSTATKFPPQYDPGFVQRAQHGTMSAAEQLALQKEQAELDVRKQEVGIKAQDLALQRQKLYGGSGAGPAGPSGQPGAPVDPATLVPRMVPEARQKDVFEEIKNAADIKRLSPQIMAAFDRGSSRNPLEAQQGQKEFEGLINTTVKEQEGTARQAAFDSIHEKMTPSGLLQAPGENASKRRTVQEYLGSKASAPTAKGFGIDLSKYPSTNVQFGTVKMVDPKGKVREVPEDMVDSALKAGGRKL